MVNDKQGQYIVSNKSFCCPQVVWPQRELPNKWNFRPKKHLQHAYSTNATYLLKAN